jgi:phosphoserine phosphatase RsbU/P
LAPGGSVAAREAASTITDKARPKPRRIEPRNLVETGKALNAETPAAPGEPHPAARILVVEDDRSTRIILEKWLKKQGHEVESAEDGAAGLELARRMEPDIIISDWMMPEMDGQELCARVKADPGIHSTYFILLTARDLKEDMISGLDAGADEYLVKPYDPVELMARVRAAGRIVRLQQTLREKNRELREVMARINQELETTSKIQLSLLPQQLMEVTGYRFAARYRPSSECSGDYYDLIGLAGGRFGMIMADVSGHGTPAMVAMALTRSLVHLFAPEAASPAELLTRLNRMLYAQLPTSQYVTAFYAVVDAATGGVTYSAAGHNPPLLLRRGGADAEFLKNCEGFPLKLVTPDAEYANFEFQLDAGDALLLYTDGIPEAFNGEGEQFLAQRLREAALEGPHDSPEHIVENVTRRLAEFLGDNPINDDVTMLAVCRE